MQICKIKNLVCNSRNPLIFLHLKNALTELQPVTAYNPGRALLICCSHNLHMTHLENVLLISRAYLYVKEG